jgi:hypothetical protein
MKTIFKIFLLLCILGCGVLIVVLIWSNSNSFARKVLSQPNDSVKAWLLERTPLGTSMDNVRSYAASQQGWVIFGDNEGWSPTVLNSFDKGPPGPYLRCELGHYTPGLFGYYTLVTVFWVFDSSNRLDNILIWKTEDGP